MTYFRRIPLAILPVLLVLAGLGAAVAGVYLLAGLAYTLLAGGVVAVGVGLLVDV